MNNKIIAPSILSADFSILGQEIHFVEQAGAEFIHVDVMDGQFVPNLTIGMPVVKSLRPVTQKILDVHLMIEQPERYIEDFIRAGSDYLTLHIESTSVLENTLKKIKSLGAKAGITLKPKTPIDLITPYLKLVDLVLVMTVEPGFGGQSFMHDQLKKIEFLKKYKIDHQLHYLIEVDGGINKDTAALCWSAGADILVAGSAVFKGEKTIDNYRKNIKDLL